MSNLEVHYSSQTTDWETPQKLFDELNRVYKFDIDVCATSENAKCARFYSPEDNGLNQLWQGHCWMNPPYGRNIGKWVQKAHEESQKGATVVCLLPARTDTVWWHKYVMQASEIKFIKGRLKFSNSKDAAPFPSVIVIFRPKFQSYTEFICAAAWRRNGGKNE